MHNNTRKNRTKINEKKERKNKIKFAIIMTVRNRSKITQRCINSILKANQDRYDLTFFITNDGSSDDTEKILKEEQNKNSKYKFHIYEGDGNLYWSGGMRLAYGEALKDKSIDFYLWVNDDVEFFYNFFDILLNDYNNLISDNKNIILCGPMQDKETKKVTYTGFNIDTNKIYRYFRKNCNQMENRKYVILYLEIAH